MSQTDILNEIDKQIKLINPKYGTDIIFGLKIAKDIVSKDLMREIKK